jgi:hypothetical protein
MITQAPPEAVGKRKKKRRHRRGLHFWHEELATMIKKKKEAYPL